MKTAIIPGPGTLYRKDPKRWVVVPQDALPNDHGLIKLLSTWDSHKIQGHKDLVDLMKKLGLKLTKEELTIGEDVWSVGSWEGAMAVRGFENIKNGVVSRAIKQTFERFITLPQKWEINGVYATAKEFSKMVNGFECRVILDGSGECAMVAWHQVDKGEAFRLVELSEELPDIHNSKAVFEGKMIKAVIEGKSKALCFRSVNFQPNWSAFTLHFSVDTQDYVLAGNNDINDKNSHALEFFIKEHDKRYPQTLGTPVAMVSPEIATAFMPEGLPPNTEVVTVTVPLVKEIEPFTWDIEYQNRKLRITAHGKPVGDILESAFGYKGTYARG